MSIFNYTRGIKLLLKLDRYKLDKKLDNYYDALTSNDDERAEEELDIHILKNPRDEEALYYKAIYLKNRGEYEKAIEYLRRANKAHASYAKSRYLLGQIYLEQEEFELARTYLYSGVLLNENPIILKDLGKAHIGLGNNKEAIKCLKKSIRINRHEKESYETLIDLLISLGKDKEAIKYEQLLVEVSEKVF